MHPFASTMSKTIFQIHNSSTGSCKHTCFITKVKHCINTKQCIIDKYFIICAVWNFPPRTNINREPYNVGFYIEKPI